MQTIGTWDLREKARKLWDHDICNECVYLAKPPDVNGEISHILAEKYVRNNLWFHIRWAQLDAGKAGNHYDEAIIEFIPVNHPSDALGKLDIPVAAVDGHRPMLVEVPEFIKLPERLSLHGICSVVRLKRVKRSVDAVMEQGTLLPVGVIGRTDGKDNFPSGFFGCGNGLRKQINQIPCELVESTAQAVHEVRDGHGDFFVRRPRRGDYEEVLRSIKIIFLPNGVRVAFNPASKLLFSRLEVKVSPSGFHVHVLN